MAPETMKHGGILFSMTALAHSRQDWSLHQRIVRAAEDLLREEPEAGGDPLLMAVLMDAHPVNHA
jgi:hypothetical protein